MSQCNSSTSCPDFHLLVPFDSWLQSWTSLSSSLSPRRRTRGSAKAWTMWPKPQTKKKKRANATGAAQRVVYVSNIVLGKELSLMCSCFLPRSVYSETCPNRPQRAGTAQTHKRAAGAIVWTHRGHKRVIKEYRQYRGGNQLTVITCDN